MTGALFELPADAAVPAPADTRTRGQRQRDHQAAAAAHGLHPLTTSLGYPIRLHADADRSGGRGPDGTPRCGTCVYRVQEQHGRRTYPKCHAESTPGRRVDDSGRERTWTAYPRVTHGQANDVAAWWPACTSYTPQES